MKTKIYNFFRKIFIVERYVFANLEWLDDGKNGVKWTECELKDAKYQIRVSEFRFKWFK